MDRIARPSIAQTLDRGLQVLEAVARSGDPVTVAQAAAKVGIDRTVAHRLIATLSARGYLHRETDGGYRLGPTCLALASAIADLRTTGRPTLEALAEATGETVQLVILSGREVVFIDGIESKKVLRVSTRTGRLLPAHSTSVGKAWLAALSAENYKELYESAELRAVTDRTITDRAKLESELARIRRRGYATSAGESENGVGSVGTVVRDPSGEPRLAISVALPLQRWSGQVEVETTSILLEAAAALGARL